MHIYWTEQGYQIDCSEGREQIFRTFGKNNIYTKIYTHIYIQIHTNTYKKYIQNTYTHIKHMKNREKYKKKTDAQGEKPT